MNYYSNKIVHYGALHLAVGIGAIGWQHLKEGVRGCKAYSIRKWGIHLASPEWKLVTCKNCLRNRFSDRETKKRFWAKVKKLEKGCWEWQGYKFKGYGKFRFQGESRQATRVSWFYAYGELPPPHLHVCHKCDNPSCINPQHLFLGTDADNVADMCAKGRNLVGENDPKSKLTNEQVREIKALLQQPGANQTRIGEKFGVSHITISDIARRVTWKHI